jgi:hypothetical protein
MNNGFIVLHRTLLDWEWYTDERVSRLFLHCLLKANYADKKLRGKLIERGSFQTSYQMLSNETGLSVRNVRTSLNKLKMTGELTIKSNTQNTIIVINNYDTYQTNDKQNDKQLTNKRQTIDKQLTTNNNDNNINNDNKKAIGLSLQEMIEAYTTNIDLRKTLEEFVQHRNANVKTKLSELAMTKNLKELDRLFDNDKDKIESINQTIANGWKGVFPVKNQIKKNDKVTYTWQAELKAEQDAHDAKEYKPKRSAEEAKEGFNKL